MPDLKRLRRSNRNKMIAGVCAGLASWLGWDVTLVRVFFVVGSFVPVIPGFLVYIVLWIVVPAER
ncbi:PspC domain-containing protein [Sphingobacteriales bacterium CHB3]|nr:PspC domain-containing protein [Sphingobacteriales bacterium CHB3]